jgi:hypothetical protein
MNESSLSQLDIASQINDAFNLITKIKNPITSLSEKAFCFHRIWEIAAKNDVYKFPLCHSSLGLLPLCKDVLTNETDPVCINSVINVLWYLSRENSVKPLLCSKELKLLPILLSFLTSNYTTYFNIHKCLSNCGMNSDTHEYLLNEELGYILFLKQQHFHDPSNTLIFQSLFCLMNKLDNSEVHYLLKYNIHIMMLLRLLSSGSDPVRWVDRHSGIEYWCLNFLTLFSTLENGSLALLKDYPNGKENFPFSFFYSLCLNSNRMESVKGLIILTNTLFYSFMSSLSVPLLTVKHVRLDLVLALLNVFSLFHRVMAKTAVEDSFLLSASTGFGYGVVKLRNFSVTLFHLSLLHPSNALNLICNIPLLRTVNNLIELFVENAPECSSHYQITIEYGGGGGKDYDTMEYSLRLFYYLIIAYNKAKIIKNIWTLQNKNHPRSGEELPLDESSQSSDTKKGEVHRVKAEKVPEEVYLLNDIAEIGFQGTLSELEEKLQRLLKQEYQTEATDGVKKTDMSIDVAEPRFIRQNIILFARLLLFVLR